MGPAPVAPLVAAVFAVAVMVPAYLAVRRYGGDPAATAALRRVLVVVLAIAAAGTIFVLGVIIGANDRRDISNVVIPVAVLSFAGATLLALVGLVFVPWTFLLVRALPRERAARARAEERANVAAHLHDSVLQTLTLIQKQAGDRTSTVRLARHAERDLRAWLYDPPDAGTPGDLAAALARTTGELEDRFGIEVELVTAGTCPLDDRTRAVVDAAGEAVTNAARHAGVRHVSVFAEAGGDGLLVRVRDRGRGFDPAGASGRHGIADSITGRMRRHGGTATIRSAAGEGTEVELRMPGAP